MNTDVSLRFTLNHEFAYSRLAIGLVHRPFSFKKPGTIVPYLIRKVTKSYWNHCCLLMKMDGKWFILEADTPRVHMIPLSAYEDTKLIEVFPLEYSSPETAMNLHELQTKAMSAIYKVKYSLADLLWFMPISIATRKFYGKKYESFANKMTCYEYVAWVLSLENWYKMTPNEFYSHIYKMISDRKNGIICYRMGVYQSATLKSLLNQ